MTTPESASSSPTPNPNINPPDINPKRGEVWKVDLEPVQGSEQAKARPVVVLSQPPNGRPTVRVCVPVTNFQPVHERMSWCVPIAPDPANGLTKKSTADTSQVRALDLVRFQSRLGEVSATKLQAIGAALVACIEYEADTPEENAQP